MFFYSVLTMVWISLLIFFLPLIESNNGPEVTVTQGKLRGKIFTGVGNFEYYSFLGIPYGKPPIGNLRFKDPQPAEPWNGVLEADEDIVCAQNDIILADAIVGKEDCLILNVHTPTHALSGSELLPVMFFIHAGVFTMGSGTPKMYGPQFLVKKNVILVTINYRLGVLGFLNLNIPEVPGNAGLKDQLLALRWVNENIKNFGGDPNKITIFGSSPGAVSVGMLLASPQTEGLFSRAIIQSGAPFSDWAIQRSPENNAKMFLESLNLNSNNKDDMLEALAKTSLEDIFKNSTPNFSVYKFRMPFVPSIEKSFPGVEGYITECPLKIFRTGRHHKVPTIIGWNSNEGIWPLYQKVKTTQYSNSPDDYIIDYKELIPYYLTDKMDGNAIEEVGAEAKKMYLNNERDILQQYSDAVGDVTLGVDSQYLLELIAGEPNVYCYKFSYLGDRNVFAKLIKYDYEGASSFDEIGYLFDVQFAFPDTLNERDQAVMDHMLNLWTGFATHGTTCEKYNWSATAKDSIKCLMIDETIQMSDDPYINRDKFWSNLRKKVNG